LNGLLGPGHNRQPRAARSNERIRLHDSIDLQVPYRSIRRFLATSYWPLIDAPDACHGQLDARTDLAQDILKSNGVELQFLGDQAPTNGGAIRVRARRRLYRREGSGYLNAFIAVERRISVQFGKANGSSLDTDRLGHGGEGG
jgi:predicted outer membrane repeat protein